MRIKIPNTIPKPNKQKTPATAATP
jgi:hypothetical protein